MCWPTVGWEWIVSCEILVGRWYEKILEMIDRVDGLEFVKLSSKSELYSQCFGHLKFSPSVQSWPWSRCGLNLVVAHRQPWHTPCDNVAARIPHEILSYCFINFCGHGRGGVGLGGSAPILRECRGPGSAVAAPPPQPKPQTPLQPPPQLRRLHRPAPKKNF